MKTCIITNYMKGIVARSALLATIVLLAGCSFSEEVKRIEAAKLARRQREASTSTNLTGEQIFVRSCNSCHPRGRQGLGPGLEKLNTDFPDDASLKKLVRSGKGIMPAQPAERLNEQELTNLLIYLRELSNRLSESKP